MMLPASSQAGKSIASRFSAAAGTYDSHADVQYRTADQLINLLEDEPAAGSILEIGCGTGILTRKLLKKFTSAQICATDISSGMILYARKHLKSKRIRWITGDFREIRDPGVFELVISSSVLHWITPLEITIRKISSLLGSGGILAFGMMLKGTLAEIHETRRKIAPLKTIQEQMLSERKVMDILKSCSLKTVRKQRETYRVVFKSGTHCLKSLHDQGVTGGHLASGRIPLNRRELEDFVSYYDKHYKCRGGVFATYQVLYVVTKKVRAPSFSNYLRESTNICR